MNNPDQNELYQEYADQCAVENGDLYNTSAFGRLLACSPVFEPIDKLKQYEQRILSHALDNLKHRQEWRDLEADDIRHNITPGMYHMDALPLLERYQAKIQSAYRAEQWYLDQIAQCAKRIAEIKTWTTSNKSKTNRLNHWTGRRVMLETGYAAQIKKTDRYERLIYKWLGICETLYQADIAKEIAAERVGYGNKYGFNPNMQSRDTAIGIFADLKEKI